MGKHETRRQGRNDAETIGPLSRRLMSPESSRLTGLLGMTTTRQELIRHGSRLMRRGGYTDCGLIELLDAAGLPRGSFYHHFASKEGFAVATLEAFYAWHDVRLEMLAAETETPGAGRIIRYFELLLDRAETTPPEERGCLLALLTLEKSATSEAIRAALVGVFARWQDRVAELLRQGQDDGSIARSSDTRRLAGLLLHGWEGALLRARLERDTAPLSDFLELALPRLLEA
jgi:TetR/AcrR family transcriptional regulator, transcriptional repressor for nem operon